jgi:dTDP-4-dehydrorhamnose reductase
MRVLLTGGSGQVGKALIGSKPAGYEIIAPDSRTLDVADAASIERTIASSKPAVVINAAAYTRVDLAESETAAAHAINADGAGNLGRACRSNQIPLVHLSTDYVFDGTNASSYVESDSPNPLNVYGKSKLAGERQIAESGASHLILRVSWVFSAGGSNFVKTMLGLADRDSLRVVDDQRGTPCAACDIAQAIWRSVPHLNQRGSRLLMHFASSPPTTWFGFANAIFDTAMELGVLRRRPRVDPIPSADYPTVARRPSNSVLDSTTLQEFLGCRSPDWRTSLRDVLRELGANRTS